MQMQTQVGFPSDSSDYRGISYKVVENSKAHFAFVGLEQKFELSSGAT